MKDTEEKSSLELLYAQVKEYIETRYDLAVLNFQDAVSDAFSSIVSALIIAVFAMLVIGFASLGTAWWLGILLQNRAAGFFVVAGFYLLLIVVVYYRKDQWIKTPVLNLLLKKMNSDEKD